MDFFSQHSAVLLSKGIAVSYPSFYTKELLRQTAFFSEVTLKKMVEEESKRDTSVILNREGQTLRSMSSGERKVALLHYLISTNPKFLVVENFYENLDPQNRKKLESLLKSASEVIKIIQVVRKEIEILPFIKNFYVQNTALEWEEFTESTSGFFSKEIAANKEVSIPATTTNYSYAYTTFVKLTDVNISFYDKPVLKNICWEIKLGEFWQLIGENGTGKTTLLSLITGDSHKAYGQNLVLFDKLKGTEENVWEIKQKIGYFTPTITELFNKRHSVLHMVLSGFYDSIGLYVKPLEIHVKLAKEWIALLQLSDLSAKTFETLTLAQQRMVLIARAMVKHPPLLILDEPTSGLDEENTRLIVQLINQIAAETKTTIIYVSHLLENGLVPDKIFKLSKNATGSTGSVVEIAQ